MSKTNLALQLERGSECLDPDQHFTLPYKGRAYTCATCLYFAIADPSIKDIVASPCDGPRAWATFDDPHDEAAMRAALEQKFSDERMKRALVKTFEKEVLSEGEDLFVIIGEDTYWCVNKNDMGEDILGVILTDIAEAAKRDLTVEDAANDEIIHNVWPGHIVRSAYGDKLLWLRIPDTTFNGSIATIVDYDDVIPSKNVVKKGRRTGQSYFDVMLTKETYPIAYHDANGNVQPQSANKTMTRQEIIRRFSDLRREDALRRKRRGKGTRPQKARRPSHDNDPSRVTEMRPGIWPHFSYRLMPRPDETLGLQMTMTNEDNGMEIDISVPVACDCDCHADRHVVAVNPSGIELALECAVADGALWPYLYTIANTKSFIHLDKHNEIAWLGMTPSADVMLANIDDPAYMEYGRNFDMPIGQVRDDWKSLMPHELVPSHKSIGRICQLSNESDPNVRHQMIWKWLEEGAYKKR